MNELTCGHALGAFICRECATSEIERLIEATQKYEGMLRDAEKRITELEAVFVHSCNQGVIDGLQTEMGLLMSTIASQAQTMGRYKTALGKIAENNYERPSDYCRTDCPDIAKSALTPPAQEAVKKCPFCYLPSTDCKCKIGQEKPIMYSGQCRHGQPFGKPCKECGR